MNVKNGCKDLKRYPHISRRVRDTLARLLLLGMAVYTRVRPGRRYEAGLLGYGCRVLQLYYLYYTLYNIIK